MFKSQISDQHFREHSSVLERRIIAVAQSVRAPALIWRSCVQIASAIPQSGGRSVRFLLLPPFLERSQAVRRRTVNAKSAGSIPAVPAKGPIA